MHLLHLRETCRAYCHTPLQTRRSIIYNHLISNDINRGAVTTCITPHWRRRRLCGDSRTHPTINNRGAVADPTIFALRPRRITWRRWCQAYCHTPLQASMQEINRPLSKTKHRMPQTVCDAFALQVQGHRTRPASPTYRGRLIISLSPFCR